MKPYKILLLLTAATVLLGGCRTAPKSDTPVIYVSIAPLKYIVEQLADSSVRVEVLVPETTSPESYEPTVQQLKELSNAKAYLSTGLIDFEQTLEGRIRDIAPNTAYINLSEGMSLLGGHSHGDHRHGTDPHIWLSPQRMKEAARHTVRILDSLAPEPAYASRLEAFEQATDSLDRYIRASFETTARRSFAIGHTSLTYFADDYGLEQIAIEQDGKEPSVRTMKYLIDSLRTLGVRAVLFQRQTTDAAAQAIAREIGGRAIEFDPLAEAWNANLHRLTDSLRTILNE